MNNEHTIDIYLKSPLVHGTFDPSPGGNAMGIRRYPILLDGEVQHVPAVSGNALRGNIRRTVMRNTLRALNIDSGVDGFANLYAIAANGGSLESFDSEADPERIRAVRDAFPALSVLGAAMHKWFLPGRVTVGICWPVCDVTVAAKLASGQNVAPMNEIETEVWHSRLPDREHHDPKSTGVKPMPHGMEALVPGLYLQSHIAFDDSATEIERSSIGYALRYIRTLGGKDASGFGHVEMECSPEIDIRPYLGWLGKPGVRETLLTELCAT